MKYRVRGKGLIVCMRIEVFEIRPRASKSMGEGESWREREGGIWDLNFFIPKTGTEIIVMIRWYKQLHHTPISPSVCVLSLFYFCYIATGFVKESLACTELIWCFISLITVFVFFPPTHHQCQLQLQSHTIVWFYSYFNINSGLK